MTPNNRAEFRLVLENQTSILDALRSLLVHAGLGAQSLDADNAANRTRDWLRSREELFKS